MNFKKLAAVAATAFLLAACGTGTGTGYFIKGTVNGSVKNGTKDVSGSWIEGGPNTASLVANTTDTLTVSWSIQNLKRVADTYVCNAPGSLLVITLNDPSKSPMDMQSGTQSGSCSVTVTAVSATEIEGTFTATLKALAGASTFTVTNGSFKVAKSPA